MSITKVTDAGLNKSRIVTPLIINGDMAIAQRATSTSSVSSGSTFPVDRYKFLPNALGTFTISQSTTVPTGQGFSKSIKVDCTTANASPGDGSTLQLVQYIEGQNLQLLKKGTSNAETVTISFWVRSNKTGTYTLELYDNDNARQISQTYTISSADTWEKKTVNFAGDTTGALDNDNALSFAVQFWLATGANYNNQTLSTSWSSVTQASRVSGSQVNIADNTANEWYITGLQMEVGEFDTNTIPTFPFESFTSNLTKCSRYYTEINQNGANGWRTFSARVNGGSDVENIGITLPTFLRIGNPTVTKNSGAVAQAWDESGYHVTAGGGGTFSILTDSGDNTPYLNCKQNGFSGLTGGAANYSIVIGTPSVAVDAEL
tara:strand:- start:501 stop:1625 length:1125 start_codon:yes stop_codon:yes gene_type:complete